MAIVEMRKMSVVAHRRTQQVTEDIYKIGLRGNG